MTDQPPPDEEPRVKVRISTEVLEFVFPPNNFDHDKVRITILDLDGIFGRGVMRTLFEGEEPCVMEVLTLCGRYYQIGSTIMVASRWYSYPAFVKVTELTNSKQSTEENVLHSVTFSKVVKGVN